MVGFAVVGTGADGFMVVGTEVAGLVVVEGVDVEGAGADVTGVEVPSNDSVPVSPLFPSTCLKSQS